MYNKKYRLEKIEEFGRHNSIYDGMKDCICYLAYLNVGERGWFLWEADDWFCQAHRIHTSVIKDVVYTDNGNVIVTTKNTKFTFMLVKK